MPPSRRCSGSSGSAVDADPVLVVDLCTGSGAIACAVDTETGARVVAVDASPEAVALASANLGAVGKPPMRVEVGDVRDPALLADLTGGSTSSSLTLPTSRPTLSRTIPRSVTTTRISRCTAGEPTA